MDFIPLSAKDFDAFLENKWASHVFNRERLEVKEKLQALGQLLAPTMVASDGSLLECEVSTEHPALWNQKCVRNQHLFFSRNNTLRKELDGFISKQRTIAALIEDPSPLRNHIFLSVMIDRHQVEMALKLHSDAAVDRENLQKKCQEFFLREKLLTLINQLPEEFSIGIDGEEETPVGDLDDDGMVELIQKLPETKSWLVIRRTLDRDDPVVCQPQLVEVAKTALSQLLPVLHFICWSRDNDFVSMRDTLRQKESKKKSRGLVAKDRIRVTRGMFTGKTGVIQECDAKGGIKVLLGSMVVKLKTDDVTKI